MELEKRDKENNWAIYLFKYETMYLLYDFYNGFVLELNERLYDEIKAFLQGEIDIENLDDNTREIFASEIFSIKAQKEIIPSKPQKAYLSFAPAYQCNFRCSYCFGVYGQKYKAIERSFSKDKVKEVVDYFINNLFPDAKQYRIDFVSGGEPLIQFDIVKETILYVEELSKNLKKKISVWLCTNGSLLNDEINTFLSEHNVSIGISIDGKKEYHDKNRVDVWGKGTYDTIVKNISRIQSNNAFSRRYRDIWGLCTASNDNCDFVELLKHFKRLGIRNVQIRLVRDEGNYDLNLIKENYDKLACFLLDSYKVGDESYLNMILNDNDQFGKVLKRILLTKTVSRRCNAGINKVTVCPNGDIYPCDSLVGWDEFIMGNINGSQINRDILDKTDVFTREKCCSCQLNVLCGGDCYHNSYKKFKNIYSPAEDFCKLQKSIIELSIVLKFKLVQVDGKRYESFINKLVKKEEYRDIYG